ncbi:unnamed protein product [Ectocarpus sp. CCAP 1310/34]|nr:unnamed protein product [Ectocarpus sp. CCAP 1310/34]
MPATLKHSANPDMIHSSRCKTKAGKEGGRKPPGRGNRLLPNPMPNAATSCLRQPRLLILVVVDAESIAVVKTTRNKPGRSTDPAISAFRRALRAGGGGEAAKVGGSAPASGEDAELPSLATPEEGFVKEVAYPEPHARQEEGAGVKFLKFTPHE